MEYLGHYIEIPRNQKINTFVEKIKVTSSFEFFNKKTDYKFSPKTGEKIELVEIKCNNEQGNFSYLSDVKNLNNILDFKDIINSKFIYLIPNKFENGCYDLTVEADEPTEIELETLNYTNFDLKYSEVFDLFENLNIKYYIKYGFI